MNAKHKSLIIVCLLLISLGIATWFVTRKTFGTSSDPFVLQSQAIEPARLAGATPTPKLAEESQMQPSPDGTKKLVMRVVHEASGSSQYIFTAMDKNGENAVRVYETRLVGGSFSIPFNTWSPDDRYFFIQKNTGEALVFTRTGDPVTQTEQLLDVKEDFTKGQRSDSYTEVTGWASPTLLIINTTNPEGKKGSSYWYEVPSKAIIQLWGDF